MEVGRFGGDLIYDTSSLEEFPQIEADILVTTHPHFDHDAIYRPDASMIFGRMAGRFELGDVHMTGIADKHVSEAPGKHDWTRIFEEFGMERAPEDNPVTFDNVVYVVEMGGVRLLKWADNRPDPPEDVWDRLTAEPIDVLFLPVDGTSHLLSYEQAEAIVERLDPRIVIPEHYRMDGISSTLAVLEDADEWVERQDRVERPGKGSMAVSRERLDGIEAPTIYYFGHHHMIEREPEES